MLYIKLILGFIILIGGADVLIRGAVGLSKKLKISPVIIGLTVIAFGTSAPELFVSVGAALKDTSGLAIGNIVGSNIANILLILGVSAFIHPIKADDKKSFFKDYLFLIVATFLLIIAVLKGEISRLFGIGFITIIGLFLFYSYISIKKTRKREAEAMKDEIKEYESLKQNSYFLIFSFITIGLVGLFYGSELLIKSSVSIARMFNVSEDVIGLTIVAFGTSLPELAASVIAAIKHHNEIALGNVVGSNIFNILLIIGVTVLIKPISVSDQIANFDIWVMLAATLALPIILLLGKKINRIFGAAFLVAYYIYLYALYIINI